MSNEEMEQKVTEEHPEEVVAPQEEPVVEEAEAVVDEAEAVDLTTLLAQAEKKAADNWEEALRARAEMENLRRRQSRDLENAHKRALDKFVSELLPIFDSMELGVQAAANEDASLSSVKEGLDMTAKMFIKSMAKFGLEVVSPEVGAAFDPEQHQAMAMQPAEGMAANTIISVAQKGFQFNGRLLRPAMVVVAQE